MADEGQRFRAIETVYKGYRFRSRLEARWAVVLDTLDVKYDYEREGFQLSSGWYLPDFFLTDFDCWFEVKPTLINHGDEAWNKAATLARETDQYVLVACGPIPQYPTQLRCFLFTPYEDYALQLPSLVWWWMCRVCERWSLGTDIANLVCGCIPETPNYGEVEAAFLRGRQARFEHGETPH